VFSADNEGLRWDASTVVDAMKYGLPPDYLPEFTSGEPSTKDVQVAAKLVQAAHPDEDLVDFEDLVQWTRHDPKRRTSWYSTHPSERQLTFFLDEYPLREGENPAKIITSLKTLFGDLDTALKSSAHKLTQRELFEQAKQKRQDKTGERLPRSSAWASIARKNDLQGAGVMFICPEDQTIFLVRRAPDMRNGNLWSVPGGMVDDADASSWDAATREVQEELGSWPGGKQTDQTIYETDDFQYTTHVVTLTADEKRMFDVELNSEATDAGWFTTDELEDLDLHPGLAYSLLRLQTTERTASLLAPPPAMVRKVLDCAKTEGTYTVRFDETDWAHAKDVSTGFPLCVVVSPQQSLTNWWQSQGGAGKIESVYAQDERTLHLCVDAPHTKVVPEMMQYAQHLLRTYAASAPR
jgi:8-oxo-dGTP pyrophosphatase MutT (NUDIX family)